MGKSESLIEFVEDRKGHDLRYFLDSSKLKDELCWRTKWSFEEGLERTIEFYIKQISIDSD